MSSGFTEAWFCLPSFWIGCGFGLLACGGAGDFAGFWGFLLRGVSCGVGII